MVSKKWTDEEVEVLKTNYGKLTEDELIILLPGRTKSSLRMKTEWLGIRNKQITKSFNIKYFSEINLETSYWAGFIAADGSIFDNYTRFALILADKDEGHVLNFAKAISYTGGFLRRQRAFSKDRPKLFGQFGIQLSGKVCIEFNEYLTKNFNITPKKSLTFKPPTLSYENSLAFLIGYIDGDGSVNPKKEIISLSGTKEMMQWSLNIFKTITTIDRTFSGDKNHCGITIANRNARNIYNFLKVINVPKLDRKWKTVSLIDEVLIAT